MAIVVSLLTSGGSGLAVAASTATAPSAAALLDLLASRADVFQPQLAVEDDGTLLVLWREGAGRKSDLYLLHSLPSGDLSAPTRINDQPGAVGGMDLDETRAAFVTGPGGRIGVAWSGAGSLWAAIGERHGEAFAPAVRLTEAEPAYRGFVSIDFDSTGALHAAWIDGRIAPPGMEEPADLYYALVRDGRAVERNLTADQEASICGCCRTHVDVDARDRVRITFRNAADGYRDIYRIDLAPDGTVGLPRRTGPAMWELQGCPVQGPITVGDTTYFNEASTGRRRLVAARAGADEFSVVIEDDEEWRIASPPREVAGAERVLLIPGRPGGKVLAGTAEGWTALDLDVPVWATTAALLGDRLVLAGALSGEPYVTEVALTGE